jgi:CBS domain-containing protein
VVIADADAELRGDPLRMERVADAMHWGLVHCAPAATLQEVATLMADAVVHCVVVIEDGDDRAALWGVVSDLDLVAAATVRSLQDQQAGGTAMTPAVTASPHESLEGAAERMTTHGVSHLVVVDSSRRPVGVLSSLDLVRTIAAAARERRSHVSA